MIKKLIITLFIVLSASSVISIASSNTASALSASDPLTYPSDPKEYTEKWIYYRALWGCYKGHDVGKTSYDDVLAGNWFKNSYASDAKTFIGYLDGGDGQVSCGDGSFVTKANEKIGWKSNEEAFCALSVAKNCGSKSGDYDMSGSKDDQAEAFKTAKGKISDSPSFPFDPPGWMWYYLYKRSLEKFCGSNVAISEGVSETSTRSEKVVSAHYVKLTDASAVRVNYQLTDKKDSDTVDHLYTTGGTSGANSDSAMSKTCAEMAAKTRDHSGDYSRYMIDYSNREVAARLKTLVNPAQILPPPDGTVGAVIDKCSKADNVQKVMVWQDRFFAIQTCAINNLPEPYKSQVQAGTPGEVADATPDSTQAAPTTCAIEGIGWIICPVFYFLGDLNDKAFGALQNILTVQSSMILDPATSNAWGIFRNLANILFVIAFLFIIYSQITGMGLSNYGIKKLLPKIFVVAILVNISFWLTAAAVDISNIAGASLKSFFESLAPSSIGGAVSTATSWDTIMGIVLVGAVTIALIAVLITAPVVLLAFAVVLLILIARQALVLMLVIVAPVAIVAYLLPNTEQFFKKWWKMFVAMLVLYPMIAIVFGASDLASTILMRIAETGSNVNDGDQGTLLAVVALGVLAAPLFAVPGMLKGALAAAGTIGGRLQGYADRAQKRGSSRAANLAKTAKNTGQGWVARKTAGSDRRFVRGVGRISTGNTFSGRNFGAMAQKSENEATSAILDTWNRQGYMKGDEEGDKKLMEMATDGNSLQRQAALNHFARTGNTAALRELQMSGKIDQKQYAQAIQTNYGDLKKKDPRVVGALGSTGIPAGISQADMHSMKDKPLLEMAAQNNDEGKAFKANLLAAMNDREQAQHFSDQLYKDLGISRPPAVISTTTTTAPPTSSGPTISGGETSTPSGLIIPRDDS